jgi:retinoblastoma-like protein 1
MQFFVLGAVTPGNEKQKKEASKLYYKQLEAICKAVSNKINEKKITRLLSNDYFHISLIACSADLAMVACDLSSVMLVPKLLHNTGLDLGKITKVFT